MYKGKDATQAFHGGLNRHTKAARNLVEGLRIGHLVGPRSGESQKQDDYLFESYKETVVDVKVYRRHLGVERVVKGVNDDGLSPDVTADVSC